MDINDIYAENNTFDANVLVVFPQKGNDLQCKFKAEFLYLGQDTIDALLAGETVEIEGRVIEPDDGPGLLDCVLKGWTGWKVGGNDIEYSEANHQQALNQPPVRTAFLHTYFERLTGASDGNARGGRKGKRKN